MGTLIQDVRYGLRMLRTQPGFTAIAILTLALGIGANSAIFSVINAVLLRPLPYREPARLALVWETVERTNNLQNTVAPADFVDWRAQNQSFEDMASYLGQLVNLTGDGEPEQVMGVFGSENLLRVLGVQPLLGSGFLPGELKPGEIKGVVISYGLWQRRFGSDPQIVGKTLKMDTYPLTIFGVMPPSFQFPNNKVDLWLGTAMSSGVASIRDNRYLQVIGRLKAGVTYTAAQAEMTAIATRLKEQYPKSNGGIGARVESLHEYTTGNVRQPLLLMLAAAGLVLLIACANVANLLLARAASRQKEIAVRLAVGASRLRLIRQLLTESLLLSIIGGAAGLLLTFWGVTALTAVIPDNIARAKTAAVDWQVVSFTLLVSLLTGFFFGLAPGLQATRPNLNEVLKEGGREVSGGRSGARQLILIAQTALALMVLIGAGLLVNSYWRLSKVDSGMQIENLLTMDVFPPYSKYPDTARRAAVYDQMLERIAALPGVEAAGVTSTLPLKSGVGEMTYYIERGGEMKVFNAKPIVVSPNYFRTTGVPLLQGRMFGPQDTEQAPGVVVINESMARLLWPGEDPLGKQLKMGSAKGRWLTVIGVVKDTRFALRLAPFPVVYNSYSQTAGFAPHELVVRAKVEPLSLTKAVRSAVWSVDQDQPIANVRTMQQVQSDSIARQRFNMLLLAIFAALALVLAVVGLYGVMSYTVAQNRREIGIRIALGAQSCDVLRLVIGQGLVLTLLGVGMGVLGAIGLTRLIANLLFGISPTDPLTFVGVSVLLVVVALLACYLPARRAMKVDPMVALRYE